MTRTLPDAGVSPTAKERATAEGYAAALESPGLEQLASRLDEDAHFTFPGMSDARGRDSVVRAHDVLFGAFGPRKVATHRILRTDSQQSVEWTMSGSQTRDWMGVAATHKPVTFRGLAILWTKDDGSISDVHMYFDVAVVKAQLGVGPKELVNAPPPRPMTATGSPPQVFEQTGSGDEKNNVVLARSALDALENNDQAAYLAAMTDDVEVHTLERGQPLRGKDDVRAYFKAIRKAIGQLDTTVDNAWGVAQFVVVEYEITGEQLSPIGWLAPQRDRVIRLHVVDVAELPEGKIGRLWRYDNPAEVVVSVMK
jgi:ketosteroid isomerase-like protein